MASDQKSPEILAVGKVHEALVGLDPEARIRVIESVRVLLEMPSGSPAVRVPTITQGLAATRAAETSAPSRPTSLAELMEQANPGTNAQRIAVFAYYREKFEGKPRFSRGDLESYFATAHLKPPANYDRDFVEAVKKGWIHEDGLESYVTSKGLEAVASGFAGERRYTAPPSKKTPRRRVPRRKAAAKKAGGRVRRNQGKR